MRLPDPQGSYVVLIGVGSYQSSALADLPAVQNNLTGLTDVLTDAELGVLPAERCLTLSDPQRVREVYRSLRRCAASATDTLVLYYAGHGITGVHNELYLSLADTEPDELSVSALSYALIREVLAESPAANRIVILDCCYSGRAIHDMSSPEDTIVGQVAIEGTYTLTSTSANTVSLAPAGATHTAFTGELLTLLHQGLSNGPELLTFSTVYRHLTQAMTARGLPRPRQSGTGTIDQLALTRNPEFAGRARVFHLAERQREREINLLKGNVGGACSVLDYQYLPDLYVQRPAIERAWARYLQSSETVFAAVGEAGRGKTNLLCTFATELGKTSPCLFYHGSQLNGRLVDLLVKDLGIPLETEDPLAEIATRVREADQTLFVFIDAVNERAANREELRQELNGVTGNIAARNWPIRFVVSCRTHDWQFWLRNNRYMLGHFGRAVYRDETISIASGPGVPVPEFEHSELESAWVKYREGYGIAGELTHELRALCREPFFLRLAAELHQSGNRALGPNLDRGKFLDRYFAERLPAPSDHFEAMAFLFQLSKQCLDQERPSIPLDTLQDASHSICRRLLDEGILSERNGSLGFRFEIILEHVVAQYIRETLPGGMTGDQTAIFVMNLARNGLINMPGIIENLLLSIRRQAESVLSSLNILANLDDRWRAVSCAVARQLEISPLKLLPTIKCLASADNYLVRSLSASTISTWAERGFDIEIAACIDSGDWESRETVAQALGRANSLSTQCGSLLWDLAGDYHWRVRRAAGYSLLRRWSHPAESKDRDQVLARLGQISWRHKHAVCAGLLGSDLAEPSVSSRAIEAMSTDENLQVRWCVANYLSRYANGARSSACTILVADPSAWVRARLVTSLIAIAGNDRDMVLPLLEQLASDPEPAVRLKVARELPNYPGGGFVTSVLGDMTDDTDDVAFAARYSLGLISDVNLAINSAAGREVVLKIFRERIARRDIDLGRARYSKIQRFVTERVEVPLGDDPYMILVDTMCSLTAAAISALGEYPSATEEFFALLQGDEDEAIRWALVLFLVRYGSALPMPIRISGLQRLAADPHWWVRREVANGLAEFRDGLHVDSAVRLLRDLEESELRRNEPCADEVHYFINRTLTVLANETL